jgi:hypothetical protein
LLLLAPRQAREGLRIKSGAFTSEERVGRITLAGTSGLRLDAAVSGSGGVMGPDGQCGFNECEPGTTVVTLSATWAGLDLSGGLRLRGQRYVLGSPEPTDANGRVDFHGSVELL